MVASSAASRRWATRLPLEACSGGVCASAAAPGAATGGVVVLFLRRPATCGGSGGSCGGGGEPDIGGEGRGAQLGAEVAFGKLISNASFCELQLDLCLLKEDSKEGIPDSDFMELMVATS